MIVTKTDDIMGSRFFKPFVGENYEKGINGKKVLVLGASFYCKETTCKYFAECTSVDKKDSSPFDAKCPLVDYKLSNEPDDEIKNICDEGTYKKFADEMMKFTGTSTSKDTWGYFAFTNYVQFFLPSEEEGRARQTRQSDLSERDFEAFNETLRELEPDIVIVWGTVISGRVMRGNEFLIDKNELEESEGYLCRVKLPEMKKEITLINPYHPSSSAWYSNMEKFEFYFGKVIKNAGFESLSKEAAYIVDKYVKNIFIREVRDGDDMDRRIYGFRHSIGVDYDDYDTISSYEKFVVSLYAMTSNADNKILQTLEEYRIDLTRTFSSEEIKVLLKEYRAVIRYCSDRDYFWWPSKTLSCTMPNKLTELCYSIVKDYCSPIVTDSSHRLFNVQRVLSDHGYTPVINTGICGHVLLPFASDLQFADDLRGCSFDVYETDAKLWAFGQILRDAYLRDTVIHSGSSSENANGGMYDYIFSCPAGRQDVQVVVTELYNAANNRLKGNGVMCCVLPEGFCYEPEWYEFRKKLIGDSDQYSALVITLPDLLQPYVVGNICIFCLLKSKRALPPDEHEQRDAEVAYNEGIITLSELDGKMNENGDGSLTGKVVLMNAKSNDFLMRCHQNRTTFFPGGTNDEDKYRLIENGWSCYDFMKQPMLNALSMRSEKYVSVLSKYKLSGNVNLLPTRYLMEKFFLGDVKLGDVVELVTPSAHKSYKKDDFVRRLTPAALFPDYLNCGISYKDEPRAGSRDIGNSKTLGEELRQIGLIGLLARTINHDPDRLTEKCLLASYSKLRFKVGRIVDFADYCPFELSPEVIPFRLKSDLVSEDFLLKSLLSDEVLEQATMLSWGGFYDSVDRADFLQIEISVPSREEQERVCKEEAQEKFKVADQKLLASFKDFREDMHMKKHAIGQTISEIDSWRKVLQRAMKDNGGVLSNDTVVGNVVKTTVGRVYDGLFDALSRLQQQINGLDRGNGLKVEDFALTEFLNDYIKTHQNPLFEFEYNAEDYYEPKIEAHHEGEERFGDVQNKDDFEDRTPKSWVYVRFPREAIAMVLENIVSNACSHGFTDSSEGHKIRITLEGAGDYIVATVSNNGEPLHEGMTPDRIFLYGDSTKNGGGHFGLGGYEIKRLMQEFGGDVEIVSTPTETFTVSYKLFFPEGVKSDIMPQ